MENPLRIKRVPAVHEFGVALGWNTVYTAACHWSAGAASSAVVYNEVNMVVKLELNLTKNSYTFSR